MKLPEQLDTIGFRFIKIANNSKIPIEKEWQNKNNYDNKNISEWLKQGNNYGVLCGARGLIVFDFDTKEKYEELKNILPETFTIQSATRKLPHLYYFIDGEPKSYKLPGLDIQGQGKQVIGAHSKINEQEYQIIKDIPITTITQDILKTIIDPNTSKNNYAETSKGLTKGNRNEELFKLACSNKARGITQTDTLGQLIHININNKPPLSKNEIVTIVNSAYSYKTAEPKTPINSEELIHLQRFQEITTEAKTLKHKIAEGVKEPEWRIQNILPERGVLIIGGDSGSYKTFLAQDLALAIATEQKYLDQFPTKKGTVLYLDEENGEILIIKRFELLGKGREITEYPDNIILSHFKGIKLDIIKGDFKTKHEDAFLLLKLIEHFKPDVVIIDSLVRFMIGEEDKSSDVRKIFDNIKTVLSKHNISFVLLHHTTKNQKGNNKHSLRGSGDFGAFADVIVMAENQNKGYIKISMVKNRFIDLSPVKDFNIRVTNNPEVIDENVFFQWEGLIDNENKTKVDECVESIKEWFKSDNVVEFKTIQSINKMKTQGFSRTTISDALKLMKDNSEIFASDKYGWYKVNPNQIIREDYID